MPILNNLHLTKVGDNWLLTKNNIRAVCTSIIPGEGAADTLLLEEQLFMDMTNNSKSEYILIQRDLVSGAVSIIDEDGPVRLTSTEPPEHYPEAQAPPDSEDAFEFTEAIMSALRIAAKFVTDNDSAANYRFVDMNGKYISGFHNSYFYVNAGFKDLPQVMLTPDDIAILGAAGKLTFNTTERHNFFYGDGSTYVFTKTEDKPRKLDTVEARLRLEGKNFTVRRDELLSCFTRANMVSKSEIAATTLTGTANHLKMTFNDASYGRDTEKFIPLTGDMDEVTVNSKLIIDAFKAIPYETLICKTLSSTLIIQGQDEWYTFMGMQK